MAWFSGNDTPDPGLDARVRNLEQQVSDLWRAIEALQVGPAGPGADAAPAGQPPVPQQQAPGQPGWTSQPGSPGWDAEARALKASGRPIEAIRQVRAVTGWGLKEAKDYVDGL